MTGAAPRHIVVVGAGAAGLTVVRELRRLGFAGQLTVVGEEPHLPYDRPPLSKHVLTGAWAPERASLVGEDEWIALEVSGLLATRATSLATRPLAVTLADGRTVEGEAVVIATGCRPRVPRWAVGVAGVHTLRSLDDAGRLRAVFTAGGPVVVVGGGFLGLEVTAAARALGVEVTLLSRGLPLGSVLTPAMARELVAVHTGRGTRIHSESSVESAVTDATGRLSGLKLSDGSTMPARTVVVAVGAQPVTEWLADSGLPVAEGVLCGPHGLVAPGVYACGDVASWLNTALGARMRPEHRLAATEQASVVAQHIMGMDVTWDAVPFWWSDQGEGLRLQGYGWTSSSHAVCLYSRSVAERRFVALYADDSRIVGALGWNSPVALRDARAGIGTRRQTRQDDASAVRLGRVDTTR